MNWKKWLCNAGGAVLFGSLLLGGIMSYAATGTTPQANAKIGQDTLRNFMVNYPEFIRTLYTEFYVQNVRDTTDNQAIISFYIDTLGRVGGIKVQGSSPSLNREAVRAFKAVNHNRRWKPEKKNGKKVKTYFQLPVQYHLER